MPTKTGKTILVVIAWVFAGVAAVEAKGTPNVANTSHNLSATSPEFQFRTDAEEVCVFCHTPHGATPGGPLWNREEPASAWDFYDSATLSATVQAVTSVSPESLMCLSCHDGSIATNRVINPPNGLTGFNAPQPTNQSVGDHHIETLMEVPFLVSARIGTGPTTRWEIGATSSGDLSDDHPISFDYQAILDASQDTGLHPVGTAVATGVRFFPVGSSTVFRVECSSCHDPHVDYISQPEYTPFLITSNEGSRMCLGCHNK